MYLRRITAAVLAFALAVCAFGEKVVLGKLGQVTEATKIYTRPNSNSRVSFPLEAYSYVVVKDLSKTWMKVLLQNGQYGYIRTNLVAVLPYSVTGEKNSRVALRVPTNLSSRGMTGSNSAGSAEAADYALNFIGTPYVWGGNSPTKGVDCSGLVQQMFGTFGQHLPRTAAEQVHVGTPVTRLEDLRKGDRLYFWDAKRGKVGHTGIYLGNGYFVHSSRTHNGVATDYLGQKKWLNILVAARRS